MIQYDESLFNIYISVINFVPKHNYYLAKKAITCSLVMLERPLVDRMYNKHMLTVLLVMRKPVYTVYEYIVNINTTNLSIKNSTII